MNLFKSQDRRLSPIIQQDDESEYGAEVRDIPFYRPANPPSQSQSLNRSSLDKPPQTHELAALVSEPHPVPLHIPKRSR
jgi:hypothetical protein